eukprot:1192770-Pyramimonas_sp.AAC.1
MTTTATLSRCCGGVGGVYSSANPASSTTLGAKRGEPARPVMRHRVGWRWRVSRHGQAATASSRLLRRHQHDASIVHRLPETMSSSRYFLDHRRPQHYGRSSHVVCATGSDGAAHKSSHRVLPIDLS